MGWPESVTPSVTEIREDEGPVHRAQVPEKLGSGASPGA